jgi:hypothetical protein
MEAWFQAAGLAQYTTAAVEQDYGDVDIDGMCENEFEILATELDMRGGS